MTSQPTQPLTDAELATIRKDVDTNTPAYASVTRAILLAEVDRLNAQLAHARETWRAAEMAWYAGVDLLRQPEVLRGHCAAMRSALGLDQEASDV